MEFLHNFWEESTHTFLYDIHEFFFCFDVCFVGQELGIDGVEYLFVIFKGQILDTRMYHQMEQVQNSALVVAQVVKGGYAILSEFLVVWILFATHTFNHFLANSYWRCQNILSRRLLSKYIPEINME